MTIAINNLPDPSAPVKDVEALKKLQDYERAVATISVRLHEKIVEPVEDRIRKEMFSRKVE